MRKVCGRCANAARYEGEVVNDPFFQLPDEYRDWMRVHCAICFLEQDEPIGVMVDDEPDDIPCDFWEEG